MILQYCDRDLDCSRCRRKTEVFRCFKRKYKFDVDLARQFVSDGRGKVQLSPSDIEYSVNHCEINEKHLDHVNINFPGIVAHIFYPYQGQLYHCHRLIDGHHRASSCVKKGVPFYVYELTQEESIRCLMRAPEEAAPDHMKSLLPNSMTTG